MKNDETALLNQVSKLNWTVEFFKPSDAKGGQSDNGMQPYEKGDVFNLAHCGCDISAIALTKCEDGRELDLPFFMGITPTWYVNDGVLYVVLVGGNSPCELYRFIIWFEGLDTDQPEFRFSVSPVYDDCCCDDDSIVLMARHPGYGGGTGG